MMRKSDQIMWVLIVSALVSWSCSDGALLSAITEDVRRATMPPDVSLPLGRLAISGGVTYTINPDVTLTINASDTGGGTVTQMEIKNDVAFSGNWQNYQTALPWALTSGDGLKTVYIRFKDSSGNVSETSQASIILDTVNPAVSSCSPVLNAANQSRTLNAVLNFSESISQATITSASASLRIKGSSTALPAVLTKTAASVTIKPSSALSYGLDYELAATSSVKDLAGRSLPAFTSRFTAERDI